jgi:hypothetical protein
MDRQNIHKGPPMTDPNFLEFWGNYLIAVARGQKQLQEFARWMQQGFQGLEDLTAMFKESYGLTSLDPDSQAFQDAWKKATADFRRSFKETFNQLGWVTEEEYEKLAEENQQLRKIITQQEATIRGQRLLLEENGLDQTRTLEVFRELIQKQGNEFQKLMNTLSESTPPKK